MKRQVILAVLLLASSAKAETFKNPHGPPGSVGLTPFFSYLGYGKNRVSASGSQIDIATNQKMASGGLEILIPMSEQQPSF